MWFQRQGYAQGVFWFLMASLTSAMNDVLVKKSGMQLCPGQTLFFRFLFSMISLLPFIKIYGWQAFRTQHHKVHLVRGAFLLFALIPWCYGLAILPVTLATTLSFTTPLFVLIFSRIFLKEVLGWHRTLATCAGFAGILISIESSLSLGDFGALLLVASTILFALLDIMNKKLLNIDEGLIPLMFYSAFWSTCLSIPLIFIQWQPVPLSYWGWFLLLGVGANFILYSLLMAFRCCEISALQPFRYTELLVSAVLQWYVFDKIIESSILWAAVFIIPSTLYIAYHETRS